jgi:hypothetical protein
MLVIPGTARQGRCSSHAAERNLARIEEDFYPAGTMSLSLEMTNHHEICPIDYCQIKMVSISPSNCIRDYSTNLN